MPKTKKVDAVSRAEFDRQIRLIRSQIAEIKPQSYYTDLITNNKFENNLICPRCNRGTVILRKNSYTNRYFMACSRWGMYNCNFTADFGE